MEAGLTEEKEREREGEEKGVGGWLGGSFQFFLEATIVFVRDLPPFLLRLPKGGGGGGGDGACRRRAVSP